jgi:Transferrin binding protein-like solute binding protein.
MGNVALSVPSLGINKKSVDFSVGSLLSYLNNPSDGVLFYAPATTYAMAGEWLSVSGNQGTLSLFATGYQTPSSAMPRTGTGSSSALTVMGFALKSADVAVLSGSGSLNVDFVTGAVTGSLNSMTATNTASVASKWNDVSIKANIASGSSSFSGTTGTSASPGTSFALNTSAAGTVSGDFYGPKADNIAGVWTIGDGNVAAFGTLMGDMRASGSGGSDTGGSGGATSGSIAPLTIGAPAAPSYGANPSANRFASANNPTFDSTTGNYPKDTFPVVQTVLLQDNTAIKAITGSPTGTITFTGGDCTSSATCSGTRFSLSIPALNYTLGLNTYLPMNRGQGSTTGQITDSLSYTAFGIWTNTPSAQYSTSSYENAFAFGYQTPTSNMPTSGTANYSGPVDGVVMLPNNGAGVVNAVLTGTASLDANFASGSVAGAFTGMNGKTSTGPLTNWNSVAVSASIGAGTNAFSGTTSVSSTPETVNAMKSTATGTITGGFYGPNAEELGAVWTLSDGTNAAIGTVGGRKK